MSHDPDRAGCAACGRRVWLEAGCIEHHGNCEAGGTMYEAEECQCDHGTVHYSRRGVGEDHKCGSECERCDACHGTGYIARPIDS